MHKVCNDHANAGPCTRRTASHCMLLMWAFKRGTTVKAAQLSCKGNNVADRRRAERHSPREVAVSHTSMARASQGLL